MAPRNRCMSFSRVTQGKSLDSGTKTVGKHETACCFTKTWQKRVRLMCAVCRNRDYIHRSYTAWGSTYSTASCFVVYYKWVSVYGYSFSWHPTPAPYSPQRDMLTTIWRSLSEFLFPGRESIKQLIKTMIPSQYSNIVFDSTGIR